MRTIRRDILGHSSTTMTGDYTHSTPALQMAAMELVASYESKKRPLPRQDLNKTPPRGSDCGALSLM